jgi:hypothetical protein
LNRAKPEVALDQIEKKTASGRTFRKFKWNANEIWTMQFIKHICLY